MTDADPAYLFTSLDPKVARWWKSSYLSGKGHLLEIKVPKGARAAYIDAKSVLMDRGYFEMGVPSRDSAAGHRCASGSRGE
jgi:hypothetical protein